jgi:hypothetical protein
MNLTHLWQHVTKQHVIEAVEGAIHVLCNLGVKDELTYADAIKSLVKKLPHDSNVVTGAIFRRPHVNGAEITLLGLDASGQPIHGFKIIARKIDAELAAAFGTTDLIVVE